MNILRQRQNQTTAERAAGEVPADVAGRTSLGRRTVLGGLAAAPVLYGIGAAGPASAATAARAPGVPQGATDDLVRGAERRFSAGQLTPGTRLILPDGIKALAVEDYYHRPYSASARTPWPNVTATDGSTVDASIVPDRGALTRIAILTGFAEGWYEIRHARGRTDRVTWDARQLPVLFLYGEFGATREEPYRDRIYTLAMQPFSRNPYARRTAAE
jgi:hypothetical protein